MGHERALRILSVPLTILTTPLLIATTIISLENERSYNWYDSRPVTTFCFGYLPLALSAYTSAASLVFHRKNGRLPGARFALLDCLASAMYLGILLPIWIKEVNLLEKPAYGLLVGYLTAPMIVNMFIHFYIAISNARAIWSSFANVQGHHCPNCHSTIPTRGTPQLKEAKGAEGYSLLRGEDYLDVDADATHYKDARESVEQIHPDSDDKQSTPKAIIDV